MFTIKKKGCTDSCSNERIDCGEIEIVESTIIGKEFVERIF
jgi:hypothetical protein